MQSRPYLDWKLRTRSLTFDGPTHVMAVLNVTPDSFSDGARLHSVDEAVEAALDMFADGASIVDVGGESTRPGASPTLSTQQEMDRVLPVIEGIRRAQPHALLSIDTYRAATARAAVAAGAEIVNDVSGLLWDPEMAATCAELRCGVVVMHTRGRPSEWRSLPPLAPAEVVPLVQRELAARFAAATAAGISPAGREAGISEERIVLDPGFGFGKVGDANYALLRGLPTLAALGRPLLVGLSRKGFLGRTLAPRHGGIDAPVTAREHATLAATTIAMMLGASIVRVHQVRPAVDAALVVHAALDS
jgi:dihydropteroate synthase